MSGTEKPCQARFTLGASRGGGRQWGLHAWRFAKGQRQRQRQVVFCDWLVPWKRYSFRRWRQRDTRAQTSCVNLMHQSRVELCVKRASETTSHPTEVPSQRVLTSISTEDTSLGRNVLIAANHPAITGAGFRNLRS